MKITKFLCLAASALMLSACGGNEPTSSSASPTTTPTSETSSTTAQQPDRTNFEFVVPANYQFDYNWTKSGKTVAHQFTKIGDKYLHMEDTANPVYNYFVKKGSNNYSHHYKVNEGAWSKQPDCSEMLAKGLLLNGLYPTSDGEYFLQGTSTITIDEVAFTCNVYKEKGSEISFSYYENNGLKLILARNDDSNDVKITHINAEVSAFPIEVPQE